MNKVMVKIDNVYFASRWFSDRYGNSFEGEIVVSTSKLFARQYDNADNIIRDARLLGVSLESISIEKIA